jgi:8-oxo-dGTP pyrophosphatase MutT (NUDIX family)
MAKIGTLYYLVSEGKTLMIEKGVRENDPNSQGIAAPGGNLNPGESPLQGAIRECGEESGVTPTNTTYRGCVLFNNKDRIFKNWKNPTDFMVYIFVGSKYNGELNNGTREGKPIWVKNSELVDKTTEEGDRLILEWLTTKRKFSGVIKYDGEKLNHEESYVQFHD